uniref:GRIP domain-containing protein n=1 Tax=Pinguiococcus pyrenoidosus TaxID=172671 RepID=A0A7R9YC49_9STRA
MWEAISAAGDIVGEYAATVGEVVAPTEDSDIYDQEREPASTEGFRKLQDDNARLAEALNEAETSLAESTAAWKAAIREKDAELEELRRQPETSQLVSLENEKLEERLRKKNEELQSAVQELTKLREGHFGLNGANEAHESDPASAQQELDKLREQLRILQEDRDAQEARSATMAAEFRRLQEEEARHVDELARLEKMLESVAKEKDALETQFQSAGAEQSGLERERKLLAEENTQLQERLHQMTEQRSKLAEDDATSRETVRALQEKLRVLAQETSTAETEVESLRQELEASKHSSSDGNRMADQLKQIIAQLRATLQKRGEEADKAIADKERVADEVQRLGEELQRQRQQHQQEVESLQHEMRALARRAEAAAETNEEVERWRTQAENLSTSARDAAEAAESASKELQRVRERVAEEIAEARNAALADRAKAEHLQGEIAMLKEDHEGSREALENLNRVLGQFEQQKAAELQRQEVELGERFREQAAAADAKHEAEKRSLRISLEEEVKNARDRETEARLEASNLRSDGMKLEEEKLKLEKALQEASKRLAFNEGNETDGMVDRKLMANLTLTLLTRKRPRREILPVVADVLNFTDDERIAVGLRPKRSGLRETGLQIVDDPDPAPGFFGSIVNLIAGENVASPAEHVKREDLEGDTIADVFVDFLMKETDEEAARRAKMGAPLGGGGL